MHCTLRPATNDDRPAIEHLVFAALAEHGLQPDPGGTDSDLHDIQASYLADGGAFDLLVDEAGQIVGSVGLCRISGTTCELRKMYLAPAARGSGWGRRLLEHVLARASALGFHRVVLETASVLEAAVALYERRGFRRYAPDHLAARCDAAYYLDLQPPGAA
ncbi:MAG: GNAT family N-acetyltransferase [Gluconacetobacter diazotrophicus]|nr:GNAT family N-acetyltransferase [Gluconacetobacter diazotrophicus]